MQQSPQLNMEAVKYYASLNENLEAVKYYEQMIGEGL